MDLTTEAKYEAKLAEMRWNIAVLEKERHEGEEVEGGG